MKCVFYERGWFRVRELRSPSLSETSFWRKFARARKNPKLKTRQFFFRRREFQNSWSCPRFCKNFKREATRACFCCSKINVAEENVKVKNWGLNCFLAFWNLPRTMTMTTPVPYFAKVLQATTWGLVLRSQLYTFHDFDEVLKPRSARPTSNVTGFRITRTTWPPTQSCGKMCKHSEIKVKLKTTTNNGNNSSNNK